MQDPTTRSRRSSATVRALVLRAAADLFDEQGYEQVSTREIANRAGVTQALVFRHFNTKENLFVEAIYQPFYDFVAGYVRQWIAAGHGTRSSQETTEEFVSGLYALLLDNHKLLLTLAGGLNGGSPQMRARASSFLQEVFDDLEREIENEVAAQGTRVIDIALAMRFTVALVFGATVLDDVLFPPDRHPGRRRIVEEMVGFVIRGALEGQRRCDHVSVASPEAQVPGSLPASTADPHDQGT